MYNSDKKKRKKHKTVQHVALSLVRDGARVVKRKGSNKYIHIGATCASSS